MRRKTRAYLRRSTRRTREMTMTISPVSRRKKRGVFSKRDLCRRCQKEYQPKEHSSDSFSALCLGRGKPKSVGGGKEPSFEVSSSSSSSRCCCCCSSIESADKQNEVEREREIPFFFNSFVVRKKEPMLGGSFLKSALVQCFFEKNSCRLEYI